jgi:hypothetical protein
VVDGHQNIFVARRNLKQRPCNIECNSMEQVTNRNAL